MVRPECVKGTLKKKSSAAIFIPINWQIHLCTQSKSIGPSIHTYLWDKVRQFEKQIKPSFLERSVPEQMVNDKASIENSG